ncbi:hypothetical protein [Burkholderia lata]|uniref:hypothetical protein n=1 Tax=Burkholderia lata (strain ATCC 17760 / DSM 23089 / LMG 22485 / NCIMB 9086 / R18194 / 383) TaxID=482957 RepID=UPI0015840061|nr:hypothetical protein [Burkholderia lata]
MFSFVLGPRSTPYATAAIAVIGLQPDQHERKLPGLEPGAHRELLMVIACERDGEAAGDRGSRDTRPTDRVRSLLIRLE